MRWSEAFIPTVKEVPAEAESTSHRLMLRAGMIRRLSAGLYTYLPLALKVIRNIENIIRDEINKKGGQELLMPILQPRELWEISKRWNTKELAMLTLENRAGKEFVLGPTHEEVITDLVKREIRSYRDLPKNFYQIQTKFRDELRPRFGLIRAKEFIMKDGYSFDADEKSAAKSYHNMEEAYRNIFSRCGIEVEFVEADPGAMGGGMSHEFMAVADVGEDIIVWCKKCNYAANRDSAAVGKTPGKASEELLEKEFIDTPGMKTIEDLSHFLEVQPSKMIKTLIYKADAEVVAVLIGGDREVNEAKLKRIIGADELEMADEDLIEEVTGGPLGFSGPVSLKGVKIISDEGATVIPNAITGANKKDKHIRNVNVGRDYSATTIADISYVKEGQPCPKCGEPIRMKRGIEVGQIFNLRTKYSKSIGATFLDRNGKEELCVMGCFGIGVTRTVSTIIEQNHDENGIIWPSAVSPYQVLILPVNISDGPSRDLAERIYEKLQKSRIEVLLDDRNLRAGAKFKDADLIGIPLRITIGPEKAASGMIEIKNRKTGKQIDCREEELIPNLKQCEHEEVRP